MPTNDFDSRRLDAILSNWQALPITQKPDLVKTFTDGLNHQTYLISSADKYFVLKILSESNAQAIAAQTIASEAGLAPAINFVNEQSDVILVEYIEALGASNKTLHDKNLIALATSLQQLHSLPIDNNINQLGSFDLISYCETYLNVIHSNEQLVYEMHEKLKPVVERFLNDSTPWCFCHNDLVKENCFITPKQALFIDWEYAQLNNPWFDICTIIYYLNLNQDQVHTFIKHYQPDYLYKLDSDFYYAAQCSVLWLDMLWHLAKHGANWRTLNNKRQDLKRFAQALEIEL